MVSHLCSVSDVSKSGYYAYFSKERIEFRMQKEQNDLQDRDMLLKAYHFKNRKKGARQIKMTLQGQFNTTYNLKKIRRLMKKFNIICPIRKANPYKRMLKKTFEHTVVRNSLKRNFKQGKPGKVLLTDITYLIYGKNEKAYLSTVLDGSSSEVLAYEVSDSLKMNIVENTISQLERNDLLCPHLSLIHSDQGSHYTSPSFQNLIKRLNLNQSMSRKGNCWDNAPQESFFGHFKDEANIHECKSYEELTKEIDDYMDYYNNYRYQWGLKKMTPVQYRNHLIFNEALN